MSLTRFNRLITASVRALFAVCVAVLLVFSHVMPAQAIGSSPSSHSKGAEVLDETYEKSKEALRNEPRSMGELQSDAQQGVNEVQGTADRDKLYTPENSNHRADSVEQNIKEGLERVTGKR